MRFVLYTIFSLLLLQNVANAQNKSEAQVAQEQVALFFNNVTGFMNQKNAQGLIAFLKRNSQPNLEIVKKVIKVKGVNENLETEFEVEDIVMSIDEYRDYIEGIFGPSSEYIMSHKINSVDYDEKSGAIFANVEFQEYAVIQEYNQVSGRYDDLKVYVIANCSFSFSSTSGLPKMYYSNCVEKIARDQ